MKPAVRRTSTALAAVATVGVSTLFMGAVPANAVASDACGPEGDLISAGVCEQVFTTGSPTFTVEPTMTKLEVLLVGAGGDGSEDSTTTEPNSNGYAGAGGGGDVQVVDFSGTTGSQLNITVANHADTGSVTDGVTAPHTVGSGGDSNEIAGGVSGSGRSGSFFNEGGNGGGGGATDASGANGGDGIVVSDVATDPASLFHTDTTCYGGGGAASQLGVQGIPGCAAGGPTDDTGTALVAPRVNGGGGGGGINVADPDNLRAGAAGVVVVRYTAAPITLNFSANGHGVAPASETLVAGTPGTQPADPTAAGVEFLGWFTDASLTTRADFSAPVNATTTYFASWSLALAATGGAPDPALLPIGVTALIAGAGLVVFASRRRRAQG
ncbi:MAG: hypothetical protein JWO10_1327 [Microbacteriaceae bacterium]|nr:hypothetical protein [Microbacteriaceae bacterium]